MRWRPWFWLLVSMCCFVGALYFWRLGDKWNAQKAAATPKSAPTTKATNPASAVKTSGQSQLIPSMHLLSEAGNLNSWPEPSKVKTNRNSRLAYRLSNTKEPLKQLIHNEHALLLENALLDTSKTEPLAIPDSLRSHGDPGSYIVQSRGPADNAFRAALKAAGATAISYIPNNAYLVRGPESVAQQLQANPQVQTVVPYEPYYKVKPLDFAVEGKALPENTVLNVLLFADAQEATLQEMAKLGAQVVGQFKSPFGPVATVSPPSNDLTALAQLSGVQEIEFAHRRVPANDLSRAATGVSGDSVSTTNYMGLSGSNVLVAVADTGIDASHPDLVNRVFPQFPADRFDTNGHGTHVAGIIAGDGTESTTVSNAIGSIMPPVAGQFRGKAPGARLFSMDFLRPDYNLQEAAGRTNALISNNSWTYGVDEYDLAAASYDAAVRDSVPEVTGSQSLIYVFPTGNKGGANVYDPGVNDDGSGGVPDTIESPGTAKNVITVGAVEQPRFVTNQTWILNPDGTGTTNQPWNASTDSSNQVANFSGRGNVGIGIEGDFGRFKPDVVAPGTFVVSARSGQWDQAAYYNPTNFDSQFFQNLLVSSNSSYSSGFFVPENTVQIIVTAQATAPVVDLDVSLITPDSSVISGVNQVSTAPSSANTGNFWTYTVSNPTPQNVTFDIEALLVTTNDHGNFLTVLSNLNNDLGPYYRYESGTSMAAADTSGFLALMEEFFQRFNLTNSPALMKALLINGARSLGQAYDYQVQTPLNLQGWGQIFLPTTLPASLSNALATSSAPASMFVFDQNPTNALATGQSVTRTFTLSDNGQTQPLRVTLAWTDPPGDPVAGIKLVNDLDLVVTNMDTGEVFFGNDILAGNDFNLPWLTNTVPNVDVVNNVENVYIKQPIGTNFSVTVIGHRVNVNAVTANPNNVVQDYALVISSGDGAIPDALSFNPGLNQSVFLTTPYVVAVTNQFPMDPQNPITGGMLLHQRVGANTPLLGTNTVPLTNDANAVMTVGMTNQWHFYVLSNDMNFTNASFVTFLPPNLAVPRMGVTNVDDTQNATRPEADIDLYVSTDFNLTNLDTNVIAAADKSVGRGGTEFIVKSNAAPGAVYYVGVKSEDQEAAEYNFLGVFSRLPPSTTDTNGNVYMMGMPVPAVIPPGVPPAPRAAMVLGIAIQPITIRRVVVTNTFTHTMPGGLLGTLSHERKFAVLNNHTCATEVGTGNCITNTHDYIYEDNGEGDVPFSRPSDGPGDLKNFIGEEGLGVWLLTMVNNFPSGTGYINRLEIKLERQNLDTNGVLTTIQPLSWHYDSIDVPAEATNLTICISGNTLPLDLYVSRGSIPNTTTFDYHLSVTPPGGCLSISTVDVPPLTAGRYYIGVFNPNNTPQTVRILATIFRNPFAIASSLTSSAGPITIQDDAITYAYITNLSHQAISSVDVGLLVNDPRISDMAFTLISPNGTRVLLFENRGGLSANGLGTFNGTSSSLLGTPFVSTFYSNNFDDVPTGPYTPGAVFDGWNVLSNSTVVFPELPAPWLSNNVLVLDHGSVSNLFPTANPSTYTLTFEATHAPYLVGTVGWWPFDGNANDIFGGFDGLLSGDVSFYAHPGVVNQAFFGDGVFTSVVVPSAPALDVGKGRGFTVEGWIRPGQSVNTNTVIGPRVWAESFENLPGNTYYAPSYLNGTGWYLSSGTIDCIVTGVQPYTGPADTGTHYIDANGWGPGVISTNISLTVGQTYLLSFAYARNPDSHTMFNLVPQANVVLNGTTLAILEPNQTNAWSGLQWQNTSVVFTATSPSETLQIQGVDQAAPGVLFDSLAIDQLTTTVSPSLPAPLVEWSGNPSGTNPPGVGTLITMPLQKATATFSASTFPVSKAVDGVTGDNSGWAIFSNNYPQVAAFQTVSNVNYPSGTVLTFTLSQFFQGASHPYTLGRFRFSITTDDRTTFCDGLPNGGNVAANWTPLRPSSAVSQGGAKMTLLSDNSILVSQAAPDTDVYTIRGTTPLANITGVRLEVLNDPSLPNNGPGRELTNGNFVLSEMQLQTAPALPAYDPLSQGVQFWLGNALTNTGELGLLSGALWDTNGQTHFIETPPLTIANNVWQHVALSYDAATLVARIYANGNLVAAQTIANTNFVPRTSGDLYFGYHPGTIPNAACLLGGLDEFGLYNRPLSDCEIKAIYAAGASGKYGTNILSCPITNQVQLVTASGPQTYTFVNGLTWTNGPQWETNAITFNNPVNGVNGGATPIVVTPLDPNATVDNFALSTVLTNYSGGLLHFTEDTNVALVPIKFAPAPYLLSNSPPTLIFSNYFVGATQQVYAVGATIPGTSNAPAFGPRDWTVASAPVTVISNALVDPTFTNAVALGGGSVQCMLPTIPGHRYQLDYSVRGPGMVSWWNGDIEPLSQRAWDLIGGNNGAFLHGATNTPFGLVQALASTNALSFPGLVVGTTDFVSKIELGDPANLHLTNSFTIEGWIKPSTRNNFVPEQVEQLFFRGDSRACLDPYWLGVERVTANQLDIVFHVETGTNNDCGVILETADQPVLANQWTHIAAVFERNVYWTNNAPWPTNEMRLYVNGQRLQPSNQEVFLEDPVVGTLFTDFTAQGPFADLDPAYSPGVSIGARSRADNSEEYYGSIDELSVYGRALTDSEIAALAASTNVGKADFRVPAAQGLAAVSVSLNNILMDVGHGDNTGWTPHSFTFTAQDTNMVLALQGLEPGTIVDGVTLTELPEELNYLPEESLSALNGEDGYGVWTLEMWDTRTGLPVTNSLPTLLDWQLNFVLMPSNPPPVIQLQHGIAYTNTLPAFGFQNFVVPVPQWATNATNVLEFAADRTLINPLPVGVLWDPVNPVPASLANAIIWPPAPAGTRVLTTDTNNPPYIVPGHSYYLTITNPNPVAVTFAYSVSFDIVALTNCEPIQSFVWQAGIPRYFEFDVPTNTVPPGAPPQTVSFLLTGVQSNYVGLGSNVTVVLSQHLPLPDLTHFDYMSHLSSTNNDIIEVLTNTTPFPIQTNRWYVGVFNNTYTEVPFIVQACYSTATNTPAIIPLTNSVPFVADLASPFVAPPGPPQWFFFQFQITDATDAVLFELYNLSGDVDLVLQRDTVPSMAPYFDGSFEVGTSPEQIVLRRTPEFPDLRGNWYLGVFNNEPFDVAYTLRAVVQSNNLLVSAQPLQNQLSRMRNPPGGLVLQWNSVVGEFYTIQFSTALVSQNWQTIGFLTATTPFSTYLVPSPPAGGSGFYRVFQGTVNPSHPPLSIIPWTNGMVRISWSTNYPGETLQFASSPIGPWVDANLPVTIQGNQYVVYDVISTRLKYYRLNP